MFFYFLFIIFYFLIAWFKPKWALFLIFVGLPAYQLRFQIFGLSTTLLEVMIVVLFIARLLRITCPTAADRRANFNELLIKLGNWKFLLLAWLLAGLLATVVSPDKFGAFGYWRAYFLEPILLLLVVINIAAGDSKTRIHANDTNTLSITSNTSASYNAPTTFTTVLFGLSISALICSLWAIYQRIIGTGMLSLEIWKYPLRPIMRPSGLFPQSNFLGMFLGPLILLFFGQFIDFLKNKKQTLNSIFPAVGGTPPRAAAIYYLLVSVFSVIAIILAKSEGAIVGVIAGLIFFFIVYFRKKSRLIFIAILLLLIGYLLFISPQKDYLLTKIRFQDISSQLRLNIWQGTIKLIEAHPIFGAGLRGYQKLAPQFQKPFYLSGISQPVSDEIHPYPHNLFLALWAETGIFGLIIFLAIIFQFFKEATQKIRMHTSRQQADPPTSGNVPNKVYSLQFTVYSLMSAMVVILVHGLVDTPYFKNDLSILFWLIVGLLIIKTRE